LTSDEDTGEDKMEKGARREGKTVWEIAAYYTGIFKENMRDLHIQEPEVWCKATDHIQEMILLVKQLEENGMTYKTSDGIYFDTAKFPAYCDFAQLDPAALRAGLRVDMGDKKYPTDFALWKFSPKDAQRQMEWESPWGVGFPGWHIECSAMALKYLTQPVDIHCGGQDHIRVHHTNEIAQVEAATHKQFVRYWLHGGWLELDAGKMSKSSGTFVTLDTVKKEKVAPLAFRLFCYAAQYRSPLKFSWEGIRASENSLTNLRRVIAEQTAGAKGNPLQNRIDEIMEPFWNAVCDDLNMPQAMACIWEMARNSGATAAEKRIALQKADEILALDLFAPEPQKIVVDIQADDRSGVRVVSVQPVAEELKVSIIALAQEREQARKKKNFARADELRKELEKLGVVIKDLPGGITECSFG
jgi:cysteinyl-tRNA synthetase